MDRWISVEDRLPIKQGHYLCHGKKLSKEPEILLYEELVTGWDWTWVDSFDNARGVTHWMPLPEPPKEREQ